MTVKELREELNFANDGMEILVRPRVPEIDIIPGEFRIASLTLTFKRATAASFVVLECEPAAMCPCGGLRHVEKENARAAEADA